MRPRHDHLSIFRRHTALLDLFPNVGRKRFSRAHTCGGRREMCQRSLPNRTGALIGAQFAGPGAMAVIGEIGYQRGVEGGLIAFYRVLRGKEVTARVDFSNGIASKAAVSGAAGRQSAARVAGPRYRQ
jgi:hypothetical protein